MLNFILKRWNLENILFFLNLKSILGTQRSIEPRKIDAKRAKTQFAHLDKFKW